MKKLAITLLVAMFLAAGGFVFMPLDEANAAKVTKVRVATVSKVLPSDGTDVTCTFKPKKDSVIYEILVDNHPTLGPADGCSVVAGGYGDAQLCDSCDLRIVSIEIDGRRWHSGGFPMGFPRVNNWPEAALAIRPFLSWCEGCKIPVKKGQELVITFDTENDGDNAVYIDVTFGWIGGKATVK